MMEDVQDEGDRYATGPQAPPLEAHGLLLAGYATLLGGWLLRAARARSLPRAVPFGDLALLGVATFQVARLATRDEVTDAIRAPFTQFERKGGAGEVHEHPRGAGLRRAIGELLTCPYCAAPWVASAFMALYVRNARLARTAAATFAVAAVSDVTQQLYALLRKAS